MTWYKVTDTLPEALPGRDISRWVLAFVTSADATDYFLVDCYNHAHRHWQEFEEFEAINGEINEAVSHWGELPPSPAVNTQDDPPWDP